MGIALGVMIGLAMSKKKRREGPLEVKSRFLTTEVVRNDKGLAES
jgi:hypothetical protein